MSHATTGDESQPNILFLFADQLRPDFLGYAGDVPVRTPTIDRLADHGVRFTDAVCPSPVCNPCRACITAGFEYDRCGVPGNSVDYDRTRPSFQARLRDQAGYHVLGCGKFDLTTDFTLGLGGDDGIASYGYSDGRFNPALNNTVRRVLEDPSHEPRDPYTAYLASEGRLDAHVADYERRWAADGGWTDTEPTPLPQTAYYDEWITRQGLDLLDSVPDHQPWYLEVNFQNPHHPWDVTEEMHGWYRDPDMTFPLPEHRGLGIDDATHQAVRRNYAAAVEHLDRCVERFIDAVEERGERENTLIVFTSDHGEMLGDHGQWQKLSPHTASVGVPLVVEGPGIERGPPIQEPATILDLHATFLDAAGITPPASIDSRSLLRMLTGERDRHRDVVYSGLGSWRSVYDGRFRLIAGYDPETRAGADYEPMIAARETARRRQRDRPLILHDLRENEADNVAADHPAVVDRLLNDLERFQGWAPSRG